MAVITLFMSDRDDSKTFTSKKEADAYDKMLELAESISQFVEQKVSGLTEEQSEEIGLVLAQYKDQLSAAIKGKTDALSATDSETPTQQEDQASHLNVING